MVNLKLDKEALKHGMIYLYADDNIEIDEDLSNELLLKTPFYDLAVSKYGELIELECDSEDWKRVNPSLFKGFYYFENRQNITFSEIYKILSILLKGYSL